MNLYDSLRQILLLCGQHSNSISPKITVNMSWEQFMEKYILDKFAYDDQYITFYGYKITKLENSFIVGE
jgi:hypothetical protein